LDYDKRYGGQNPFRVSQQKGQVFATPVNCTLPALIIQRYDKAQIDLSGSVA
jgi:hypothetical protein